MKTRLAIIALLCVPACGYAQGPKACEDLKSEIAAKLDAKGVKSYSLDIVAKNADAADGKVRHRWLEQPTFRQTPIRLQQKLPSRAARTP